MKKRCAGCALCLLFLLFPFVCTLSVRADDLSLYTEIPSEHRIAIEAIRGDVLDEDGIVVSGTQVTAKRHAVKTYVFQAKPGYELVRVLYGGTDVTGEVSGNRFTAPMLSSDVVLQAVFMKAEASAPEEKKYTITGRITDSRGNPLAGVEVDLYSTPKTTVTDRDGNFRFENVTAGWHTLLLYREGAVIGYGELMIAQAQSEALSDKLSTDGTVTIIPSAKTIEIHVDIQLDSKGNLVYQKISDRTQAETEPPANPTGGEKKPDKGRGTADKKTGGAVTGDSSDIWVYGLFAGGSLAVIILTGKRKRTGR